MSWITIIIVTVFFVSMFLYGYRFDSWSSTRDNFQMPAVIIGGLFVLFSGIYSFASGGKIILNEIKPVYLHKSENNVYVEFNVKDSIYTFIYSDIRSYKQIDTNTTFYYYKTYNLYDRVSREDIAVQKKFFGIKKEELNTKIINRW